MAANAVYPPRFPGFMRPEPLQVWRTETTLGEAGPQPLPPEPQEDAAGMLPQLALGSSGELAPGTTIEVLTLSPGYVGAAGFGWRRTVASGAAVTEDYRGCDVPNVMTGQNGGGWGAGTSVRSYPVGLSLPTGEQVVAFSYKALSVTTTWSVGVQTLNLSTGSYSAVDALVTGLSSASRPYPCTCYVPELDLVLLAYWRVDDDADEAQIVMLFSRDSGETWDTWQQDVLDEPVSTDVATGYTLGRLRMAYAAGQIVLFAELRENDVSGVDDQVWQWASGDMGRLFSNVVNDAAVDTYACARPEVVAVDGKFYLGVLLKATAATDVFFNMYELGSAYESFLQSTDLNVLAGVVVGVGSTTPEIIDGGELAMCRYADRVLIYVQQYGGGVSTRTPTVYSFNPSNPYALTDSIVDTAGVWFNNGEATPSEYPVKFNAQEWRGQVHIFCQLESASGDFDDKWTCIQLGGYTSRTMPPTGNTWTEGTRASWTSTTTSASEPDSQDWTAPAAAGTTNRSAAPTWEIVTTTAGNAHYWRSVDTPTESDLLIICGRVLVTSGGSVAARNISIIGRGATNLVAGYQMELWFSDTQIRMRDGNGASTIATVSADCANGVEVFMVQKGAEAVAYYRNLGTTNEDRYWTQIGTTNALTDDVGASGNGYVEFGNRTTAGAVAQYLPMRVYIDTYGAVDFVNPDDLWPAAYTTVSRWVGYELYLQAAAGPAATGDSYLVYGDAQFPARAAIARGDDVSAVDIRGGTQPSPRPDEGWRSTATSGRIAFQPPGGLTLSLERGVFVCHVERPNWGQATVQYYTGGAWTTIGTLDTRGSAVSLPYVRYGARLVLDPGGVYTNTPTFLDMELAGGYAKLSGTKIRPIKANRGGPWSLQLQGPRPTIDLDPASIDGTEPASGTMDIWYPRATFVAYLVPTAAAGFALNFGSAVVNYEGYIRAGLIIFGEGWLTSQPADWGLESGISTFAMLETLQTGQRISRTLSPSRARYTLPFICPLTRTTPSSSSIVFYPTTTANVPPYASMGYDADTLRGLIDDAEGAQKLVCYVPGLVAGTPNTYSLVSDQAAMTGRIVSEEWTQAMESGSEQAPAWKGAVIEIEQEL